MTILLTFFISLSFSQHLIIQAPCSERILWAQELESLPKNLGEATLSALTTSGLQFQGNEQGINQINHSPIGTDAIEFISPTEMFSYGWCYQVNGVIPEVYPHEIKLNPEDEVLWFYGFAHYLNGEWISQCENSNLRSLQKICQNP